MRSRQPAEKLIDLNDLRVFAYVASLASFSLAADALNVHKSSVSRSIARLEMALETPLLQRTTRKVLLTGRGIALKERCDEILSRINETIGHAGVPGGAPQRHLIDEEDKETALSHTPVFGAIQSNKRRGVLPTW
jgi:DNA-binding transcriptional LysR family regulator